MTVSGPTDRSVRLAKDLEPEMGRPLMSARLSSMRPAEAAQHGQWFSVRCHCRREALIGPNDYGHAKVPSVQLIRTLLKCQGCKRKGMASVTPVWR